MVPLTFRLPKSARAVGKKCSEMEAMSCPSLDTTREVTYLMSLPVLKERLLTGGEDGPWVKSAPPMAASLAVVGESPMAHFSVRDDVRRGMNDGGVVSMVILAPVNMRRLF